MKKFLTRLLCIILFAATYSLSQPFWNSGEGPYGGTILDFAFNSQGHIYGAGYFGLYKSTNDGQNWEPISPQLFSNFFQVSTVAIDQMDNIYTGSQGGIFKSTDNGMTWNPMNNGLLVSNINTIEINSSGVLFAGSFGYIYRSVDGGANWTEAYNGLPPNSSIEDFAFDPATDEIFVGTSAGVFSSTDNGDNWTDISSGLPANSFVSAVEISPPGNREASHFLYAGTGQGVYRFDRVLLTWVFLATGLGPEFIYALAVNAQGDLFVGTALGIFRHLINDNQWTQLNVALVFSYVAALAISPLGHILAAEDWGGPLISMNNGNTWLRIITGLTAYGILSFYYSHLLSKFFIGSDAGYFKGLAALTGWVLMYPQSFPFFLVTATVYSAGILFAGTYFQGMWRSTDEGVTWEQINNGLTNLLISAVVLNALGHLYVSTQGGGVFFSDNSGDSWTALNNGLTALIVTALILSPLGQLYAATLSAGIFRYDFNASQWVQLITTGLTSLYVTALTVNLLGGIFAVIDGSSLFYLPAGASAWIALGLTVTLIYDLFLRRTALARGGDEVYVATQQGVYFSTDSGSNWELKNTGLEGGITISKFAADSSGGIYIAVSGRGTLQGGGGPNIINLTNDDVPDNYNLNQNYPNPFNPSTTISFSIPEKSFVTLEIFNSLGEKIATLLSESLSRGNYNYNWDANSFPSGVYLYKLKAENFIESKKMILIK